MEPSRQGKDEIPVYRGRYADDLPLRDLQLVEGAYRFVILTRPANESMIEIHDRMPVIVGEKEVRPYLTDRDAAAEIIATASPMLDRKPA